MEVPTINGIADALGLKKTKGDVYYIEAKVSRADLICKKQRNVYRRSVGMYDVRCYCHNFRMDGKTRDGWEDCGECKRLAENSYDTGVDFYYVIVADGVVVEPSLYPMWGVLDQRGNVIRKAKRMKRATKDTKSVAEAIAHVLVYKVYGKLYAA